MICIYCFHTKTTITNSRGHKKEASTWRRHACQNCGRVFSSLERPSMADSYKIADETNGTTTAYTRARVTSSLIKAFGHLPTHDVYPVVDALADTIERSIITSAYYGVVSKDELGVLVWDILKKYDAVAGVQYAAQNGLVSAVSQRRRGRPSIS